MDGRLYLEVNHFAKDTPALHDFMVYFASYLGLGLIVLALVAALWLDYRNGRNSHPYVLVWGVAAAAISVGVATGLARLIDRLPPYVGRSNVEVLVAHSLSPSMPNVRAAIAGALVISLYLARQWVLAALATVLGVLVSYGCVYIGASYPGDVLAGAGFGVVVTLVGVGLLAVLGPMTADRLDRLPTASRASERRETATGAPAVTGASSSVRLLSDAPLVPQGSSSLQAAGQTVPSS